MAEMSEKNKSVLGKLRDKMDGGINRLLTTLAFVGCVNAMSAKTISAGIVEVDGTITYLMTKEGRMKIDSPSLVAAITKAHNKKGGELVVKFNFDENTSRITKGKVYHSRVRVSSGMSDAIWDIRDTRDDISEVISYGKDLNLSRLIRKSTDIVADLAPEPFRGGVVRILANGPRGKGWAQYHTVDRNGYLKPEYDKTATQTSQSNYNYTQTATQRQSNNYNSTTAQAQVQNYTSTNSNVTTNTQMQNYTSTYSGSDNRNQAQKPPKVNLRIYE